MRHDVTMNVERVKFSSEQRVCRIITRTQKELLTEGVSNRGTEAKAKLKLEFRQHFR